MKRSFILFAAVPTLVGVSSLVFGQTPQPSRPCKVNALALAYMKVEGDQPAKIEGVVADPVCNQLPGATINLVGPDDRRTREFTTDESGKFSFSSLPDGVYTLKVHVSGFKDCVAKKIELRHGEVAQTFIALDLKEKMKVLTWIVTKRQGTKKSPH